jgi:hypothetical protein
MFPFVIQMNEIVMEKEFKLRKALQAMGLHDVSYWLSWHMYQSAMALFFGFFIWVFGSIFQFRMFLRNGAPARAHRATDGLITDRCVVRVCACT